MSAANVRQLSQVEHILTRPDMYVGSVDRSDSVQLCATTVHDLQHRVVDVPQALLKIFDETVQNALDACVKDGGNRIAVSFKDGGFEVENAGAGIPSLETISGKPVARACFDEFRLGSNFDDDDGAEVGGRNGIGIKAANVFAAEFTVETVCPEEGTKYTASWAHNMNFVHGKRSRVKSKKGFVRIRCVPDWARFGGEPSEVWSVWRGRAVEAAAWSATMLSGIKVTVDGEVVKPSIAKLCSALFSDDVETITVKGSYVAAVCVVADGRLSDRTLALVNGIRCCSGPHVEAAVKPVVDGVVERMKGAVRAATVRRHLAVVVMCTVARPVFDSQSKERLRTPLSKLTWRHDVEAAAAAAAPKLLRRGLREALTLDAASKDLRDAQRESATTSRKRLKIDKLDDALMLGTSSTLFLTEGDSAKAFVTAGIGEVMGRKHCGVYPLRGKFFNALKGSVAALRKNAEAMNLTRILGLELGKTYTSITELRYGHVCCCCDSDVDGTHIVGLIYTFFHALFPSVLKVCPDYVSRFVTPILRASLKSGGVRDFTHEEEYRGWAASAPPHTVKYFKGLGTWGRRDAVQQFKSYSERKVALHRHGEEDDAALDLAFGDKREDDRKVWLSAASPAPLTYAPPSVPVAAFVTRDLVFFSKSDNDRSLPHVVDGFKESQRKCFWRLRTQHKELRVSQAAASVAETTQYHHGEASLVETICLMAQTHVGANNIALLEGIGQFGSRLAPRKVHAQPRYIFTKAADVAALVFPSDDTSDAVVGVQTDEGQRIQPNFMMPVIPLLLVNGSEGIGTGFSASWPPHNPADVIDCCTALLDGGGDAELPPLQPWFHGFKGTVQPLEDGGGWSVVGCVEAVSSTMLRVTELPPTVWIDEYKARLEALIPSKDTEASTKLFVRSVENRGSDTVVDIMVCVYKAEFEKVVANQSAAAALKLVTTVRCTNMHAHTPEGVIEKFTDARQVVQRFAAVRLGAYERRKQHALRLLEAKAVELRGRMAWIQHFISNESLLRQPRAVWLSAMEGCGAQHVDGSYDYLFSLRLDVLTTENVELLARKVRGVEDDIETMRATSCEQMWRRELAQLSSFLHSSK